MDVDFTALMAATKFHFDGPKALPLESARTRRALDPLFDATWEAPFLTHETGRGRPVFESLLAARQDFKKMTKIDLRVLPPGKPDKASLPRQGA